MIKVVSFNIRYCCDLNGNSVEERVLRLEKINYFWLSDTPDVESKGWD